MSDKDIKGILEYISGHIYYKLAPDALAKQLYVSKFHFYRLFTGLVGMPPARYVRLQKLRHGAWLLLTTEDSVTEIALCLGFGSHDVFTRAFKQMFRQTPSHFRRTYKTRRWVQLLFKQRCSRGDGTAQENTFPSREAWRGDIRRRSVAGIDSPRNGALCAGGTRLAQSRMRPGRFGVKPRSHRREEGITMYDFLSVPFTIGDKREAMETVELLYKLAKLTRNEGTQALGEYGINEAKPVFLKKGISMICDGWEPKTIKSILENHIKFSSHEGVELLKRLIIMEGLLSIQAGESPALILERMLSLLGDDFYEEAWQRMGWYKLGIDAHESDQAYMVNFTKEYFNDMDIENHAATHLLEGSLLNASDYATQLLLREADIHEFESAFFGASKALQKKFCNNLSARLAMCFVKFMQSTPPPDVATITKAQHAILSIFHKLKADGSIES